MAPLGRGRGKMFALLAVGLSVIALGGIAFAAIPDSKGEISACYDRTTGALRVIDVEAGTTCLASEVPLSWNRTGAQAQPGGQGPVGPEGPAGPQGPAGAQGPPGAPDAPSPSGPPPGEGVRAYATVVRGSSDYAVDPANSANVTRFAHPSPGVFCFALSVPVHGFTATERAVTSGTDGPGSSGVAMFSGIVQATGRTHCPAGLDTAVYVRSVNRQLPPLLHDPDGFYLSFF